MNSSESPKIIWVLGSYHNNADKCIYWSESFPNFSNCDILIVNLQTLTEEQFRHNSAKLLKEGRNYIFDLLMTGEKNTIIILNDNQKVLNWLPIVPILKKITQVNVKEYSVEPYLEEYCKNVNSCNFYIHGYQVDAFFSSKIDPKSATHENYFFTNRIQGDLSFEITSYQNILNEANQNIGNSIKSRIKDNYMIRRNSPYSTTLFVTGEMVLFPPPTEITVEQGIDLIINNLLGKELRESPPDWEEEVDVPSLSTIEKQIACKEKEQEEVIRCIKILSGKKNEKIYYRRLLWTKGTPLEDAVKDAFIFLGFPEIKRIRSKNLEDWVFEFQTIPELEYGVLEVKGANKRTSLADLTQCNKWVEDYMLEHKKAKGIFIPNQHRLEDIRTSENIREHFEPNEKEYAKSRKICILPTYEIFKAVVEKTKNNNEQINRNKIESILASNNGLCKLV